MKRPLETKHSDQAVGDERVSRYVGAQEALDREANFLRPFAVTEASRRHYPDDDHSGRALTLDDFPNTRSTDE
jgi:hypothetical protein